MLRDLGLLPLVGVALSGCFSVPTSYAVIPNPHGSAIKHDPRYRSIIGDYDPGYADDAEVKDGFRLALSEACTDPKPAPPMNVLNQEKICEKSSPLTDYACWAVHNWADHICVSRVVLMSVKQCSRLVGKQSRGAALLAQWTFPFLIAGSLAADGALLAGPSSVTALALATTVVSTDVNVDKGLPTATSMKASDFTTSGQGLTILNSFSNNDIPHLKYTPVLSTDDRPIVLDYALFLDDILSTCPANNR